MKERQIINNLIYAMFDSYFNTCDEKERWDVLMTAILKAYKELGIYDTKTPPEALSEEEINEMVKLVNYRF